MPRPPASPSPPPISFAYTTGSFDYPHASTTSRPTLRTDIASATRHAASPSLERPQEPPAPSRLDRASRRGRFLSPELAHLPSMRPPTANPNRPRATPSERYLRRSQARIRDQRSADMDSVPDFASLLSDMPGNDPFAPSHPRPPPSLRARSPTVEVNSERRNKRRKLQHDTQEKNEYTCYKYGYKGQVVPGRLRMEIFSCDGGEHRRDNSPGLYRVQNVLRNDKSVYCSERSQCNLLLKHMGEASFALEKVVIRAPDRGFNAPVQEGLVFVSMSADELLPGTAAYCMQYESQSPARSPSPVSPSADDGSEDEQLSLREAMNDPRIWQHMSQAQQATREEAVERIENLRRRRDEMLQAVESRSSSLLFPGSMRIGADMLDDARAERQRQRRSDPERRRILRQMVEHEEEQDVDNCDHAADESYNSAVGMSAPTPPPFTVTTATEEEESDSNEEISSAAILADRLRRESRWRPDSDEEDDGRYTPPLGSLRLPSALDYSTYGEWRERRERYMEPIRATRVATPSRIDAPTATDGLIHPHARFFIAKNKNKITIKFTPAISGKHVLLKLWSPKHDGNIDIESVQFYGYSGPRFFPATQPR
ncbi:hypothetical protein T440DRAFT_552216 [Plenodomus tracheiphilus IPT5]|uniref:Uncharacterized protein n=1 Tax=Plenodomus tracheiphilus IPT5 TaxID=1408161 RepID=A0A6A7BG22_9PLEO|nr:hypothetical protein T440DRAFT_552216 [Plenodomus tracheiphilus IPT5]